MREEKLKRNNYYVNITYFTSILPTAQVSLTTTIDSRSLYLEIGTGIVEYSGHDTIINSNISRRFPGKNQHL